MEERMERMERNGERAAAMRQCRRYLRQLCCGQRTLYRVGTLGDTHFDDTRVPLIEVHEESTVAVDDRGRRVTATGHSGHSGHSGHQLYTLWPVTEVFMSTEARSEDIQPGVTALRYHFHTANHVSALMLNVELVHKLLFHTKSYRYFLHTRGYDKALQNIHKKKDLLTLVFGNRLETNRLLCTVCDNTGHPAYHCPNRPRDTPQIMDQDKEWHHPLVDSEGIFRQMKISGVCARDTTLPWNLPRRLSRHPVEGLLAPLECMVNANDCLFYCIAFVLDPSVHFKNNEEQKAEAITKAKSLRNEACDWIEKLSGKSYSSLWHIGGSTIIDDRYISGMRKPEHEMASILEAYALCCKYKIRMDLYSFTTRRASCSLLVPRASDIDDPLFDYSEGMRYFCSLHNEKDSHWRVYTKGGKNQVEDGFFESETAGAVMDTGGLYKDPRYHDVWAI